MIIGIMGAMPDEVDQLCARLENVTVEPYGGVEYHKGTLAGKQVVVCCAGMGKANAAATTQVLITKFGAEKIIFSGIAGNMTSKIGIGDVVIGKTVLYHDAQLDMICQNPPFLKEYTGDPALIAAAEKACADAGVKALAGKIATGDMFVGDSATKAAIETKCAPDCVEMEGAAVSQIAAKNDVPCVILRAMSDNADEDGHEVLVVKKFSITEYVATATKIVAAMVFFPFLTILSILIGILGGYLIAAATGIMIPADYVDGLLMDFKPYSITYTLIKTVFFAYIITSISAFYGYNARGNSLEVGAASTRAVVASSVVIMIFNLILTQVLLI